MTLYEYVGPERDRERFEQQVEGLFAPVEQCVHGNVSGHIIGGTNSWKGIPWIVTTATGDPCWCDGKPKEPS